MFTPPKFITFTGADDATDIDGMVDLSRHYPIEWAILFSPKRQGTARYPTIRQFCLGLDEHVFGPGHGLRLSAHLCGDYAESVITEQQFEHDRLLANRFHRVQINTGRAPSTLPVADIQRWGERLDVEPILQCREFPNDPRVAWLYDPSGGRGQQPASWPKKGLGFCGYAGGINPGNVQQVIDQIDTDGQPYWIDLETGARDKDDRFSLDACYAVCEAVYGARGTARFTQTRLEGAEDALRALASSYGAGGYNAPTVDAEIFEAKIRAGVDDLLETTPRAHAALTAARKTTT